MGSPSPEHVPPLPVLLRVYYFLSYVVVRAVDGLIALLPLQSAFRLGGILGAISYHLFRRRQALALSNLQLAFGREKSSAELEALNQEHFRLLGANLMAALRIATLPEEQIWTRVTVRLPAQSLASGWIALISHIGNWELFSHLGSQFSEYRFGAVYRGFVNPFLDLHLQRARERFGVTLFERRTDLLKCVRFLREGGVVGVLVDQSAGYAGLWTPLFGKLTSTSTLAATLSTRTDLPVVPIAIYTTGEARWEVTVSDPIPPANRATEELTAEINRLLERQIKHSPADWLWSHDRWKPLRPHFLLARDQRRTFFPRGYSPGNVEPFRVLIVAPAAIDEARATLNAVRAIAKGRPDAWIAVLTLPGLAGIWRDVAEVHHLIEHSQNSIERLAAAIRAAAKFEAVITFVPELRSAIACWRAGIPVRVGRGGSFASVFYNQHPAEPRRRGNPERAHLRTAQSVGANINEHLHGADEDE